jgi:two-component system cell cycle response regulator DivK
VRFKEVDAGSQQGAIAEPGANLIRGQAGECEEPLGASFVGKGRGENGEAQCLAIARKFACHRVALKPNRVGKSVARILVVEDNALNIKLFCDLLAAHGHEPEAVTDSREALETARAFKPDLVITDIQLPYLSGLELMEQIRGDDDLATVPIMAVTAYSGVGDDERIRAAGAQAYVSKPISVMRFAETVDQLLEDGPVGSNEKGGPETGAAPEESNPDKSPE